MTPVAGGTAHAVPGGMSNTSNQRGEARRVRVRSAQHYEIWRLHENCTTAKPQRRLSPAALWMLIAYLPPHVRSRPWVRHLVERQLARVDERPAKEQDEVAAMLSMAPRSAARAPISPVA